MENNDKNSILESLKASRSSGFLTPKNYFNEFNQNVLERIKAQEKIPEKKHFVSRKALAIAASLVLLLGLWQINSFFWRTTNQGKVVPVVSAEVEKKLQELDEIFTNSISELDEYQINEAVIEGVKKNESATSSQSINKEQILEYLSDENLDITDM